MKSLIIWRTACILLFFTLITTHFSAALPARYTSTASGSDSARVAKFAGGTIEATTLSYSLNNAANTNGLWYAFVLDFTLKFDSAEVARKYQLDLILQNSGNATFQCQYTTDSITGHYSIDSDNKLINSNVFSTLTNTQITKPTNGAAYFSIDSSWKTVTDTSMFTVTEDDNYPKFTIVPLNSSDNSNIINAGETPTYSFQIMYFVQVSVVNQVANADAVTIVYDLICEQVD